MLVRRTCVESQTASTLRTQPDAPAPYISPFRPNSNCEAADTLENHLLLDMYMAWPAAVTTVCTSFFFSALVIAFLRYSNDTVIWGLVMGVFMAFLSGVLLLWVRYSRFDTQYQQKLPAEKTVDDKITLLS